MRALQTREVVSVQMAINLTGTDDPNKTGGFGVVDGSHKWLLQRLEEGHGDADFAAARGHYNPFARTHPIYGRELRLLALPARSAHIWSSLAAHCPWAPLKLPPKSAPAELKGRMRRIVSYVTLAPWRHLGVFETGKAAAKRSKSKSTKSKAGDGDGDADGDVDRKQDESVELPEPSREARAALVSARLQFIREGGTTSHWPLLAPRHNRFGRPRNAGFEPLQTPACCLLDPAATLPEAAMRLVTGT